MKLKKHLFIFLIFNLTIHSVISEDISLIEETLKNVKTKINHINKTSYQMLPNHPDGEFEILKMFQDILPDIEKVAGNFNTGLCKHKLSNLEFFNHGLLNHEPFNHKP